MKIMLLAVLLTAAVRASANPDSLKELQDCSTGQCWDSKGQPVTAVPQGGLVVRELTKVRRLDDRRPAEPPRYTVLSREEVEAARKQSNILATGLGAAAGVMVGSLFGGIPGAVVGGLIGAGIGYLLTRRRG
ncbi:MAG: hypothetical protein ABL955_05270 [Elusimicrobiota bacterium]